MKPLLKPFLKPYRWVQDRFFPALRFEDYRRLWLGSLSASAAVWGLIVARGWLVYNLSDSSLWVGLTTFAAMIPLFLVPPIAGFLADRVDRRKMLAFVYSLQLVLTMFLAILALTGAIDVWHVVALSFASGVARAGRMPATQALLPNVVPKDQLLNAVALNSATMHGSRLLGAGLVLPLLATTGAGPAFALCTGFYAAALFFSLRIRTASTGEMDHEKSHVENFFAGLTYVYRHPMIFPLVVVVVLHCSLTMSFESLLPVLSDTRLGGGDAGFSLLMMAVGGGALIGVMGLAAVRNPETRGRLLLGTGVLSGVSTIGLAMSTSMAPAMLAAGAMGASQAGFMTLTATIIQAIVPDAIRGRVMSVYLLHIGGMMASFNLANGALADVVGAQWLLAVPGVAFLLVLPLSFAKLSLRRLYVSGSITTAAPTPEPVPVG